jgi:hypothetical protein
MVDVRGKSDSGIKPLQIEVVFERNWQAVKRANGLACSLQIGVTSSRCLEGTIKTGLGETVGLNMSLAAFSFLTVKLSDTH